MMAKSVSTFRSYVRNSVLINLCISISRIQTKGSKLTYADGKLFSTHDVIEKILHFKGGQVEETICGFIPRAFQHPC